MDPHDALRHYFQFPEFRPGQEDALRMVLAGHDALVVMPTGSGKSLIYQLAALLLPHTSLVISPLVALMKDQVDSLSRRGIPATFINSSLDSTEQAERLRNLAAGRYKIVLVAPERLRLQSFRAAIARLPLSQFVIDEAHCLSQWGHDFRPDYLHIAEARRELKAPVTLALTATATRLVQDDILRLLDLPEAARLITGFNRPNLALEAFSTPDTNAKLRLLRDFLPEAEGAGIIYVGTRRDAEEVADFVRDVMGLEVDHYHAGLDADARSRVQDAFMSGDLPIVVATNAFGMGIDRPDVRFVLHYTMPGSLEAYYQEAGRAGRDGLPARAMLCYSPKDTALQEFFIDSDAPGREDLRALYDYLKAQGKAGAPARVAWEAIEGALGMPQVKVRVGLEQLELAGGLRRLPAPNHRLVEVQTLPLSDARLNAMAAEAATRREHKHHLLDLMVSYAETDACRRRTMLDYFGDHGDADAAICCDNCLARVERETAATQPVQPAQTQAERGALIVLDTIAHLKWGIGQSTLAQVLKGSGAQKMKGYLEARNYAKFAALRLKEIEALIAQLTAAGYIKQVGSTRPTLRLTPRGEDALKTRAAIEVELRPVRGGETRRRTAQRAAGNTVALSEQMLARGLTTEQIAAERGLTVRTIYSHLAQSIAAGAVDVNAVVPLTEQQQVRAAIVQAGSAAYLAPIKALLPEEIDYGVIRCVVEAWKREHGNTATNTSEPAGPDHAARVVALGNDGDTEHVPELIDALNDHDGNVRRLAASALGKLRAHDGIQPLLNLLAAERGPQVRQYAITALGKIGDARATPMLESIAVDLKEQHYVRTAAETALKRLQRQSSAALGRGDDELPARASADPVADFLSRSHVRPLKGPWLAGWALDWHSYFDGDRNKRGAIGDLVFRYKYEEQQSLAPELATHLVQLLATHPEVRPFDGVIPIPPTTARAFDPVNLLARSLAQMLGLTLWSGVLAKTRVTRPQKDLTSLAQKQANIAGAFALRGDVRGKRLLLVDDLYDSGTTLQEAARVLIGGGVAAIVVLTLTRTIHSEA